MYYSNEGLKVGNTEHVTSILIRGTAVSNTTCNTEFYECVFYSLHTYIMPRYKSSMYIYSNFHILLSISVCMFLSMLFNTIAYFVFHHGGCPKDALSSMRIFTIATCENFGLVINEKNEVIFKVRM